MSDLHDTDYQIKLKQGLAANINATATKNAAVSSEPHWTTDTKTAYIFDGTVNESVTSRSPIVAVTVNTTLNDTYEIVEVTAACIITLPTAVGRKNKIFEIIATVDGVTVDGDGSETINDEIIQSLSAGDAMRIISNNVGWRVI